MEQEIRKIGVVAVDSGKLMICDPIYLQDWKNNKFENIRQYIDKQTEKVYIYKKDFDNYSDILFDEKSVKQLIQENRLEELEKEIVKEDFSYNGLTKAVNQSRMVQYNFPAGHEGLAVAFASENGDGEYPVFAQLEGDKLKKVWIDFE